MGFDLTTNTIPRFGDSLCYFALSNWATILNGLFYVTNFDFFFWFYIFVSSFSLICILLLFFISKKGEKNCTHWCSFSGSPVILHVLKLYLNCRRISCNSCPWSVWGKAHTNLRKIPLSISREEVSMIMILWAVDETREEMEIQEADDESSSESIPPIIVTVAIAVNGSKSSRCAVKWALEKFVPEGRILFRLLHVRPKITMVPTPSKLTARVIDVLLLVCSEKSNTNSIPLWILTHVLVLVYFYEELYIEELVLLVLVGNKGSENLQTGLPTYPETYIGSGCLFCYW